MLKIKVVGLGGRFIYLFLLKQKWSDTKLLPESYIH